MFLDGCALEVSHTRYTHVGNIFGGEGAKVSLIDCGQFKALPRLQRVQLAELVLAVTKYQEALEELE